VTSPVGSPAADEAPVPQDGVQEAPDRPESAGDEQPAEVAAVETVAIEAPAAEDGAEPSLAELSATMRELAGSAERYHDRAAQREGVIDYLRAELETLRWGERRGMLRPLLTEMCRLRNDLLRQAATLPEDYDAGQAAELLISFAETVEQALQNNGVDSYAPGEGEPFDPRLHRRRRGADSTDPGQAGRIAGVLRDGYLELETNNPIVPAEVTVFMPVKESK
jgi:molecular chaperone GrpE